MKERLVGVLGMSAGEPHFWGECEPFLREAVSAVDSAAELGRNETAAVAFGREKTAALCFDRVWGLTSDMAPDWVRFWGGTETELAMIANLATVLLAAQFPEKEGVWEASLSGMVWYNMKFMKDVAASFPKIQWGQAAAMVNEDYANVLRRVLAEGLARERGVHAVPLYDSISARDREYRPGDASVVVATLSDLRIVDEGRLGWDQARAFREDDAARRDYKRMIGWLDEEMVGKELPYIEDEIGRRIEEGYSALSKHGIRTVAGDFVGMFLQAAGGVWMALAAGAPEWAVLGGTGLIIVGNVVATLTKMKVDIEKAARGQYPEVAFVYEAKKRLSG